jgi:hypothetical protein
MKQSHDVEQQPAKPQEPPKFNPKPGPQERFMSEPQPELIYGGARIATPVRSRP